MSVWKFSPVARDDDPHWSGYRYKRPLLVEAESESDARLKATRWYKEQFQGDAGLVVCQFYRSAFDDVKLYEAMRIPSEKVEREKQKYPLVV